MNGLVRRTKDNPIKSAEIVSAMNRFANKNNCPEISGSRLRKLCNFIRTRGMIPLIATSKGYYCSNDPDEISKQIQSLNERADAIRAGANGLKEYAQRKGIQLTE